MRIQRNLGRRLHRKRLSLWATPVALLLFFFSQPASLWAGDIYVGHGLRLFEEDNFFSQWQDLNDEQRGQRSDDILSWLKWVQLFGTDVIVDAPDTPLAAFDLLLPEANKPALARTVDLDQMIGLFNESGLNIVLEIRPDSGDLKAPENQTVFVNHVKSLVERYDGDTDFGIDTPFANDELPYPDINKSWVVSSADLDGTSDEEKVAFAEGHVVKSYSLCAGLDLSIANLESHSGWVAATIKGIKLANSDVKVFVGPFRLSQMKKGFLETLLGPVLLQSPGSLSGILLDVDTPIASTDLGGGDLETSFTNIRTVLKQMDGEDLELIAVGNHIPAQTYEQGHSWVRPCPEGVLCNEDIQGQLLIKTLLRMRAKGLGIGVAAPIGFQGNDDTPGPLATVATTWVDDAPIVNASGMAWIRMVQELSVGDRAVTEVSAPVQNVRMIRIGDDDTEQVLVAWYDWYRESAPGQPYSGIQKSITVDAPEGTVEALLTPLNGEVDSSIVALPGEIYHGEATHVGVNELGQYKITLEDQLVVVRYSTEVPKADIPPAEIVESPDAGVEIDEGGTGDGGSSGCNSRNHTGSSVVWLSSLLFVALLIRRRRRSRTLS